MPIVNFQIDQRIVGFSLNSPTDGEQVRVLSRELIGPQHPHRLSQCLEHLHNSVFRYIPDLPMPSYVDHILVLINKDLSAVAYYNELNATASIRVNRDVEAGEEIYQNDISEIASMDLGVDIPEECAVILMRSQGWRRSVFYDLMPLLDEDFVRDYDISSAFAQQALLLLGMPLNLQNENITIPSRLEFMESGLHELINLLDERCEQESRYQELLAQHTWMFSGTYTSLERHQQLDEHNIPDFIGLRCLDGQHELIEIKQPFLQLFRQDGNFTSAFNDSWSQAVRYFGLARRQSSYLKEEKSLIFDAPRCLLIMGYQLSREKLREINNHAESSPFVRLMTYDRLIETAQHIISLTRAAGERVA